MNEEAKQAAGMDARLWARNFNEMEVKKGLQPTDPELMTTWFANAIMAGYDAATAKFAICDSHRAAYSLGTAKECPFCEAAKLQEQVKRISDFSAEVINARKDPTAICLNCGIIQPDQLDAICVTCGFAQLKSLIDLRDENAKLRKELDHITRLSNELYTALREGRPIPHADSFRLSEEVAALVRQRDKLRESRDDWKKCADSNGKDAAKLREELRILQQNLDTSRATVAAYRSKYPLQPNEIAPDQNPMQHSPSDYTDYNSFCD